MRKTRENDKREAYLLQRRWLVLSYTAQHAVKCNFCDRFWWGFSLSKFESFGVKGCKELLIPRRYAAEKLVGGSGSCCGSSGGMLLRSSAQ